MVIQSTEADSNFFQRYLIPAESRYVRIFMRKAGEYGTTGNFVTSRLVSVVASIAAIIASVFNAALYLLQMPLRILLNVVRLDPFHLITHFIGDLTNSLRSVVFVSIGMTFIFAGILFPSSIFSHFSPGAFDTYEAKLEYENSELKKEVNRLEKNKKEADETISKAYSAIEELKRENERLKGNRSWWKLF